MLRKLLADHQPQYIAASFDLRGTDVSLELAADYKANRAPMPGDLAEQIPWVHEACEAMGVPIFTSEGFEADDVIGTLASRPPRTACRSAIVTGDKDFFQLVGDGIRVYNPRDEGAWFDAAGVKEKFGVAPAQVVDVLALMGDSIDNVKGVPGIGEKGARDLIATYGSLDALLARAARSRRRSIARACWPRRSGAAEPRAGDDSHRRRRAVRPSGSASGPVDRERCYALFSKLGFRTLVTEFAPTASSVDKDYAVDRLGRAELEALVAR